MTYTPSRDSRFEYIEDLITFIEENQCRFCYFRKHPNQGDDPDHAESYPMCYAQEGAVYMEEPMDTLDDKGDDGVVCNLFKLGEPPLPVDPDQLSLIGE